MNISSQLKFVIKSILFYNNNIRVVDISVFISRMAFITEMELSFMRADSNYRPSIAYLYVELEESQYLESIIHVQ